jgi:hypothetical protein
MRRPVLVLLALTLALASAACGGDDPDGANPGATPSLDAHAKGVKFAQCMRENGVEVPDPEPGKGVQMKFTGGVTQEQVTKAMEACREWAPEGALGGGAADTQRAEQLRKHAQCMRDNGVEAFPDPEGGVVRMDRSLAGDPDYEAAEQACAKELRGVTR